MSPVPIVSIVILKERCPSTVLWDKKYISDPERCILKLNYSSLFVFLFQKYFTSDHLNMTMVITTVNIDQPTNF